jgi:hypothetical protein
MAEYYFLQGFATLIEHEWLRFGHLFDARSGVQKTFTSSMATKMTHVSAKATTTVSPNHHEKRASTNPPRNERYS